MKIYKYKLNYGIRVNTLTFSCIPPPPTHTTKIKSQIKLKFAHISLRLCYLFSWEGHRASGRSPSWSPWPWSTRGRSQTHAPRSCPQSHLTSGIEWNILGLCILHNWKHFSFGISNCVHIGHYKNHLKKKNIHYRFSIY